VSAIEEFLDELQHASWFSILVLSVRFHQIQMDPANTHKTTFQTHEGHYEFRVMSFDHTGTPHTFQKAMNATLAPLLRKGVLIFFDDILVYSRTYTYHLAHLDQILHILQQDQWTVKLSKCSFAKREIAYLGYVISEKGVATCPYKVKVVVEWPRPRNVKEVRCFLGLARYYRRFVRHYGIIAKPLTELLKKNRVFQWTSEQDTSFHTLKETLTSAPILTLPYFTKAFVVETDAS
jgi:hypothetical protein